MDESNYDIIKCGDCPFFHIILVKGYTNKKMAKSALKKMIKNTKEAEKQS